LGLHTVPGPQSVFVLHWTQAPAALQTLPPLSEQAAPWNVLAAPQALDVHVLVLHCEA
jgi:hypothetical protein